MANIDFPSTPTVGQRYTFAGIVYTFTAQGVWSPGASVTTTAAPQGRLTLQTGNPVMVTGTTGATSIFYTPYAGNRIPIFNGVDMAMTPFVELIGSTVDITKNPAVVGANKVNDWFVWNDVGTLRLGHGPDWTNDITRSAGTVLLRVQGVLVNNVAITNGPVAQRGTYVGTTRSNAASTLDWTLGGENIGGMPGFFGVWNAFHRVEVSSLSHDLTVSWTYSVSTWRASNASNNMRASWVTGLAEDVQHARFHCPSSNTAGGAVSVAIDGVDPTLYGVTTSEQNQATFITLIGEGASLGLGIGFHYMQAVEVAISNGSACLFYGSPADGFQKNGLRFYGRM